MRFLRHLLVTLAISASSGLTAHGQTNADVIVYGSTPGGYCAAIAAAREGASVILLEPTDHVGGMNTGGLCFSDSDQMYRDKLMGLFHEWHLRIQQDYEGRGVTLPYNVNVKNQVTWSYEAKVAQRVTNAMLTEAGVTVLTGRYLQSVTKAGPRITSIVTSNGTFTGRVFIDGSYEGDLMAAAGVSWRIDRESRAEYGESYAGRQYPKSLMDIDGFDNEGNPLPLITATGRGANEIGDDELMVYSYRIPMTKSAANKVAMPAPANYDPARFELIRRYVQRHGQNAVNFSYLPVPRSKIDANNAIGSQFSIGLIGGAKDWAEADQAGRAAILEAHKQYTLEMIHFMKTDPVFTQARRDEIAGWGLCADEFADSSHFPPQLYVRASRRMRGMYVIKQSDILDDITKTDPIMVSSFPIDSHDCRRVIQPDGKVINEGTIFPVRQSSRIGYPYHVPYRSILPPATECDNLLVPVALSCTHVAISSLRIEATWMLIGQSAGIAAALAKAQDIAVQDLPYATLKPRLEAQGQVLTLPDAFQPETGIVLDDPAAVLAGTWTPSTSLTPFVGTGYRFAGAAGVANDGSATATFRFTAPQAGTYQFNMAYAPDASRATNVPVSFTSGPNVTNFSVDQTVARPAGSTYRLIGSVTLVADQETVVTVGTAGTTGFVILDAIRLVLDETGGPDETPPVPTSMLPMGNGAATAADLAITFNEEVQAGSGSIRLFRGDGTPVETISASAPAVTISGAGTGVTIQIVDLDPGTSYYVNIDSGAITDLSGNAFGGISNTTTWAFTTATAPLLNDVIYSETFSGGSVGSPSALNSTTPDVTTGAAAWVASDWRENGSTSTIATSTTSSDDDSAFLPFAPVAGKVYTLSAKMTVPSGGGTTGWVAIGFAQTNTTAGSFWSNNTAPWMFWRPGNATSGIPNEVVTWLGPGIGTTTPANSASEGAYTGTQTFSMVLDTTGAAWKVEWLIGGSSVRTETYGTNPTIGYVGFGRENGQNTQIDDFSLTVVIDNTFANWIAGKTGVGGQTALADDPDGDGVPNAVENFFGTHPGEFSRGLVAGTVDGVEGIFTFAHPQGTLADDLEAAYRWSKDLVSFHAGGVENDNTTVSFSPQSNTPGAGTTTVSATVSGTPLDRLFVDVKVTPK